MFFGDRKIFIVIYFVFLSVYTSFSFSFHNSPAVRQYTKSDIPCNKKFTVFDGVIYTIDDGKSKVIEESNGTIFSCAALIAGTTIGR